MLRDRIDNYEEYKQHQISRSTHKWGGKTFRINWIYWESLTKEVFGITGPLKRILCQGIRNDNEYSGFRKIEGYKDTEIWGTDINPLVTGVGQNCYCLDFNKMPDDWKDKFDMIYSNSLDHAFEVEKTINEWWKVVKNGGWMYLDLSGCIRTTKVDVYAFFEEDLPVLFKPDKFEIVKIWNKNGLHVLLKVKK